MDGGRLIALLSEVRATLIELARKYPTDYKLTAAAAVLAAKIDEELKKFQGVAQLD